MMSRKTLIGRLDRLERARRPCVIRTGAARFDWYAEGCPCGLPAGECREHPRARASQRPPAGAWRTWLYLGGRGAGKTRAAAEWVRSRIASGSARRVALVGATAADARDVIVEGPSGILSVCPIWDRPRYEPSRRRLTWPNGAVAITYSAEEPDRLRGPQHDAAYCDELATWSHPAAWDNLLLGLRLGRDPRACVTTTPRPVRLLTELMADPTTATTKGTTYENRSHLAPSFFTRVITKYEGTRLGQQELLAEVLEVGEGAWFDRFDPARHVTADAEYDPRLRVHLAIDAGTSPHTAAVWFQVRELDAPHRHRVTVFGDFHCQDLFSAAARAIWAKDRELPHRGALASVRLDPAATARSSLGPAAYGEYERVFGPRTTARWPWHHVADGLDQLEVLLETGCLLIHPRCVLLKAAFQNYCRKRAACGDYLGEPADPQHPHEDLMDALRGGIRDRFPEGRIEQPRLRAVHAGKIS
jgi:phage terminase large subunit-like protein